MPKLKTKNFPQMTMSMWKELVESESLLATDIFENPARCDDLLVQLGSSVRNGVLAASPPSLRADVLHFFEKNCVEICKSSEQNRLRHVYESLRDHLGLPTRDGPKIASQLRDFAIKSLTAVLIALDSPKNDPRLTKFHIELLYRLLLGRDTGTPPVAGTAVQDALQDRRFLAVECLQMLENAYPTLLSVDASSFVALAVNEAVKNPTPGFIYTQLAASVVSHISAMYLHQQEEYTTLSYEIEGDSDEDEGSDLGIEDCDGLYSRADSIGVAVASTKCTTPGAACAIGCDSADDENGVEEVLTAAADVLCLSGTSRALYDAEDDVEVDFSHHPENACCTTTALGASPSRLATPAPVTPFGEQHSKPLGAFSASNSGDEQQPILVNKALLGVLATSLESSGTNSPRGILRSAASTSSAASGPSKQSSKRSMLASVAEADELDSAIDSSGDNGLSPPTGESAEVDSEDATAPAVCGIKIQRQPSALTFQLRRSNSTGSVNSTTSANGTGIGMSWSAATTPRTRPSESFLLQSATESSSASSLRRFTVPLHIQTGDSADIPRLVMNAEAHAAMQTAATTFINAMRRLNPSAVAAMTKVLPPILRCARPSPTLLWPLFERQLSTGSTPLLRAVLDLHDSLPELFEGRAPSLIEKVLAQVNDRMHSTDHRIAGASWVLRQHAMQRHSGGTLLLADSWEQLLPIAGDPPQLTAIKVKALGACLAAGVGDEEVVCRAVCSWEGFLGPNSNNNRNHHRINKHSASEQQLRAFTYALRILHSSAPTDGPAAYRTHACLITGILEAIVSKPQLVPAVDAFLETSSGDFSGIFLKAVNALFSGVDGQFETLKERPEDVPFQGTTIDLADRVKAAVISRSSSLSGLMRGLSFSLSFSKRNHSHLNSNSANSGSGCVRRTMSMTPTSASLHGSAEQGGAIGSGAVTPRFAAVPVVDVRALRSSVSAAFQQQQEQQQQHQGDGIPVFSSAMSDGGASSVGGAFAALVDGQQSPGLLGTHCSGVGVSMGFDASSKNCHSPVQNLGVPTVPLDLPTQEAAEIWLSSPATWESLSVGILQHDLLAYRLILKRALHSAVDEHPRGILRTIANYTWQYKEHHPSHTLSSAKVTGDALVGLCHAAALAHLPCGGGDAANVGWTLRQLEVADSIQNVLDAIEEGFPVPEVQSQCQVLATAVVAQEAAWVGSALGTTLRNLLDSYIDAAVQG